MRKPPFLLLCVSMIPVSLFQPAHAEELSVRQHIAAITPIADEALRRMEFRRGSSFQPSELMDATRSAVFEATASQVTREFCAERHNMNVLACTDRHAHSKPVE